MRCGKLDEFTGALEELVDDHAMLVRGYRFSPDRRIRIDLNGFHAVKGRLRTLTDSSRGATATYRAMLIMLVLWIQLSPPMP